MEVKVSENMVERVARAIAETGNGGVWTDETWYKEYQRDFHRKRARAAIEAMKEPTRSMVNAAWQDNERSPTGVLVEEYSVSHAREADSLESDTAYEVWQAMISAALTD